MPLYEYRCNICGEKFEVRRGFFEREKETRCPKCGSEDTQRVYSSTCGGGCSTDQYSIPRHFG
jgi:putative FmdB family regulatory protein